MRIDLETLFNDPALMFYAFEGDHARFLPMDRHSIERSIFLDGRIIPAQHKVYRVPLAPLLEHLAERGFVPPRLNLIHHMAQTGSTLLARALDHRRRSLVLREPLHLRQVAVHAGAGFEMAHASRDWRALLGLSLTMLGKRFDGAAPTIVKGNVPITMIGDALADADPRQAGILLYFPLIDYCCAVLRTPQHRAWVESVTTELRLGDDPVVGPVDALSTAQKAGALWLSMIRRFQSQLARNSAMRSLDANRLFHRTSETIKAASDHFGVGLSDEESIEAAHGPIFSTYAKNPAVPYAAELRSDRNAAARRDLGSEIDAAHQWVESRASFFQAPAALDRPLTGGQSALLQR